MNYKQISRKYQKNWGAVKAACLKMKIDMQWVIGYNSDFYSS